MNKQACFLIISLFLILLYGCQNNRQEIHQVDKNDSAKSIKRNLTQKEYLDSAFYQSKKNVLALMNEKDSLMLNSFRFILTRSFDNPVIIRIEFSKNECKLFVKTIPRGQKSPILQEKIISREQFAEFDTLLQGAYFWSLETFDREPTGFDGSIWTLEGRRKPLNIIDKSYQIVTRYSPHNGSYRNACMKLIEFADLKNDNETH